MKKSLVALAVLAAASAASAQSSVTLFGVVDANVGSYRDGNGTSATKMNTGGTSSNRFGVRGIEDLGGGLSGVFWLEAGIAVDSGAGATTNTNNQASGGTTGAGLTFNRRSTVALAGSFGEVRIGRDYTPGFRAKTEFDPFGTVGVAAASNLNMFGTAPATAFRASNGIAYLWNDGGFGAVKPGVYAQAQYRLGENSSSAGATKKDGNGYGLRVGYAQGPLNVSVATDSSTIDNGAVGSKYVTNNLGVSYDLGMAKLMGQYYQNKTNAGVKATGYLLGAAVPVGAGVINVSYNAGKTDQTGTPKASQLGLGYVHNLSKRTAVYTNFATLSNKNGASLGVNGGVAGVANKTSSGIEFGVKHSF